MIFNRAEKIQYSLIKQIKIQQPGLLNSFPIKEYIAYLEQYDSLAHYKFISSEISNICSKIVRKYGDEILELYHKLLITALIVRVQFNPKYSKLPTEIQQLFQINFKRILNKVEYTKEYNDRFSYKDDKFNKDLSVCRLRTIPLGAHKVFAGELSKGFIFRGGVKQFFKGFYTILFDFKGFKPIYNLHMDSRDRDLLREFNQKGWINFYLRLAELLKINKDIKGVSGSSWFFDPNIELISSELSYLRQTAISCGAKIYYMGTAKGTITNATFMSPRRLKLYKEGKYKPTNYLMVISRRKLINWADIQKR